MHNICQINNFDIYIDKFYICGMITLVQLEYIVAVDNYRHFATAAEKCFVTQPTLSMQVKKLEEDLGVQTVDRSRQPVIPTDIGKEIIGQAREVLRDAGLIEDIVRRFRSEVSGELRLGIIPTLGPFLLPLFVGNFARKYPAVDLWVAELVTEEIIEKLRNEQLDAGIFVTPVHDRSVIEEPLFYEEMLIYANPRHALLRKAGIQVRDMDSPDIWLLNDGHCFRHQVVNLCSLSGERGRELPFQLEGGSLETLVRLIDREGGFTLIPELAELHFPEEKRSQVQHFSDMTPLREVSLVYSRHFAKRNILEALKQQLLKDIPEHMLNAGRGEIVEWK